MTFQRIHQKFIVRKIKHISKIWIRVSLKVVQMFQIVVQKGRNGTGKIGDGKFFQLGLSTVCKKSRVQKCSCCLMTGSTWLRCFNWDSCTSSQKSLGIIWITHVAEWMSCPCPNKLEYPSNQWKYYPTGNRVTPTDVCVGVLCICFKVIISLADLGRGESSGRLHYQSLSWFEYQS